MIPTRAIRPNVLTLSVGGLTEVLLSTDDKYGNISKEGIVTTTEHILFLLHRLHNRIL